MFIKLRVNEIIQIHDLSNNITKQRIYLIQLSDRKIFPAVEWSNQNTLKMCTANSTHFAHGEVVQTIRTVKHHTLDSQSLGQVLSGLSLPRSRRPFRGPIQIQMECTNQSPVTPVSQRSDDQSGSVPQVFVGILDCGIGHSDSHVFFLPVVSKLSQPGKIILWCNTYITIPKKINLICINPILISILSLIFVL